MSGWAACYHGLSSLSLFSDLSVPSRRATYLEEESAVEAPASFYASRKIHFGLSFIYRAAYVHIQTFFCRFRLMARSKPKAKDKKRSRRSTHVARLIPPFCIDNLHKRLNGLHVRE